MTHTPGPWTYDLDSGEISAPSANLHYSHAIAKPLPDIHQTVNDADARLIAAAPELLAALKRMLVADAKQMNGETYDYANCVLEARAAIAKAEGKP